MKLDKLPVHPAAALFPMLEADELQELAADIKQNGLIHPIVVGEHEGELHLIDGRNRLAACKIAKVEPRHTELNGEDQLAFIVSANLNRRHMSKGQKAMATAMIYPQADKRGRGNKSKALLNSDFSRQSLGQARTVLRVLPELAQSVLAGTATLSEAYQTALGIQADQSSTEGRMKTVRERAPDLAELVDAGKLTSTEALASFHDRERRTAEEEKNKRRTVLSLVATALAAIHTLEHGDLDFNELFDAEAHSDEFERAFAAVACKQPTERGIKALKSSVTKLRRIFG